jgi:hypothetical protein
MNVLIALVLAGAGSAIAAAERPSDFAYGMSLAVSGDDALYEVTLPPAVYRGVVRADVSDLRVFNGAGEVVPHALRPRRIARVEPGETQTLTLFPLKGPAAAGIDGLSISVRRGPDGTSSVNVTSTGAAAVPGEAPTLGYLVDLTAFERALRALEFDWSAAPSFTGKLRIEASDDLATWRVLASGAPLINLEVGGQRLQQKRIEFSPRKTNYLRLSWVAGPAERAALPALETARGELAEQTTEAPREWGRMGEGKAGEAGEYRFDLGGRFPVDRVRFDLPQPNTIAQVELLSRERADQPWRPVARSVVYRLRQGGGEVASPEISIGTNADRHWLLKVDQRGGGLGSGAPVMHAGWIPHQVVFAARGEPPFQLAYGNRQAKPAAYGIQTLIPDYRDGAIQKIRPAKTGTQQTISVREAQAQVQTELGGEARREDTVDWKRWSLWAALGVGVLLLGAMAWRLTRQMNAASRERADGPGPG